MDILTLVISLALSPWSPAQGIDPPVDPWVLWASDGPFEIDVPDVSVPTTGEKEFQVEYSDWDLFKNSAGSYASMGNLSVTTSQSVPSGMTMPGSLQTVQNLGQTNLYLRLKMKYVTTNQAAGTYTVYWNATDTGSQPGIDTAVTETQLVTVSN